MKTIVTTWPGYAMTVFLLTEKKSQIFTRQSNEFLALLRNKWCPGTDPGSPLGPGVRCTENPMSQDILPILHHGQTMVEDEWGILQMDAGYLTYF